MLTAPLYVVQTWFLPDDAGYAIELAADRTDPEPRRYQFVTTDKGVYQDALDAEGHEVKLIARWHQGYKVRVLDELLPA